MKRPSGELIVDDPFPAYHGLSQDELRAACVWELDREFIEAGDDLRLPWPLLSKREKSVLNLTLDKAILIEDIAPPAAQIAFPPNLLDAFRCACEITKMPEVDSGSAAWGSEKDFWREARDHYGWQNVAFRIRPNASLEDVCEAIKEELIKLRPFKEKMIPPKGGHWHSRLLDLLCLRLERSGRSWQESANITKHFRSQFGGAFDAKIWSTRRGRARKAIQDRREQLEALRKREMLSSYKAGYHGKDMQENPDLWLPLSGYGAQGWSGSCFVGRQHPEKGLGSMAQFCKDLKPEEMRERLLREAERQLEFSERGG